jgi:hypothetical protein
MGDEFRKQWRETKDVKVGMAALTAYNISVKQQQTQVAYKKLTGKPMNIAFLND